MVKGVSANERPVAQNTEPNKPTARNVPKKEAEQFSSLMDEERNALKGHPKSKKLNKVLDKVGDGLAKRLGPAKAADQQTAGAKQAEHSDKAESFSGKQNPADKQSSADKQNPTDKQDPTDKEGLPQSLDAFDIASMIARTHAPPQSVSPTAEAAPAPPADLGKIVGEIANRILVSSPSDNPAGMQEIRIQLKDSVLPNTEVRIYRHAGSLQVEFLTGSKDSQMFIEQRQPDIQKVLGERLSNETVNVSVQDSQQTRGGQGEGRSRQQYINPDLDNDGN